VDQPALLKSGGDLRGPGHNSLTVAPDGTDVIAFHSWNADATARQLHLGALRIRRAVLPPLNHDAGLWED